MGRDCQNALVTMEYLDGQASFEEAPSAISEDDAISGQQRTFPQIVKDNTRRFGKDICTGGSK